VIRVYDASGNVIETHEYKGDFKERGLFTRPHVASWFDPTVRLSNGYSLLRQQENAVDIASGLPV
jgi:hypothetical protein